MTDWTSQAWGWGSGLAMVGLWALWLVVVGVAVWGIAALTRTAPSVRSVRAERAELDRRFASGEMAEAEYLLARQMIGPGRRPGAPMTARPLRHRLRAPGHGRHLGLRQGRGQAVSRRRGRLR
ncbi:MAG: SHOCT domain-containing protein [Candidatus Nanopelagicales bacterium]